MIGIRSDKIIVGEALLDGYVYIENGRIASVTKEALPASEIHDCKGLFVSPGFIDMHTHGGGDHAFVNSNADEVLAGCDFHLAHGTTTILPTVSAAPFPTMQQAVRSIATAMQSGKAKGNILGAHLEGPYLSAKQCGAQCPDFITPPREEDYAALLAEYGSAIARWTYAPEQDKDGSFCRAITKCGILASAGHTDATYADMQTAIENGCRLITHLYSCTSTVTRNHGFRSLGVIESAFLRDELFVEIIADGKHLPPELVQMIVKIKGASRVAAITDSLSIAGTDISEGIMSGTEFIVEDGVCKLKDRSAFAGSVATADTLVRVLTRDCGFPIPTAVKMLTETPARILGLRGGMLEKERDADIIVFDEDIRIRQIFVGGKAV